MKVIVKWRNFASIIIKKTVVQTNFMHKIKIRNIFVSINYILCSLEKKSNF